MIKYRWLSSSLLTLLGVAMSFFSLGAPQDLQGQLILQTESEGDTIDGEFVSLHSQATLRLLPIIDSNVTIKINREEIYSGMLKGDQRMPLVLRNSSAVHQGINHVSLTLHKGDLSMSVDYPVLQQASGENALTDAQKQVLMDSLLRWTGSDEDSLFPGAAVLVAQHGRILLSQGLGQAAYQTMVPGGVKVPLASPISVTDKTVFDLASVTKVTATTAAIMHLVSEKKLQLDSTLGTLLPGFADTDKSAITVRQLLTHRAGLWEWQPTWLHRKNSRDSVFAYLAALPRRYDIEEKRAYSDIGFMLLGRIVEQVSGMREDEYVSTYIHEPLGMRHTRYLPPAAWRGNIAATSHGNPYEQTMIRTEAPYPILREPEFTRGFAGYRQYTLVGEANDGNAWYGLDGVAGHAGLFSTITDLAHYCQALLNGGGYGNFRLADSETVQAFLSFPYDTNQALGFWRYEDGEGRESFGHAGFTGTQVLFRPDDQLIVILLTNRQHNGLPVNGRYPSIKPAWENLLNNVSDVLSARAQTE